MKIKIFNTKEKLYNNLADVYIEKINNNNNLTLGLATGSSPIGLYERLIAAYKNNILSFKGIKTFNLDEYCDIDIENEQSYHYFMNKTLFSKIDIDLNNVHIPKPSENFIADYEKELSENPIDIQLLGIGSNGHIAFNEPGTPFTTRTHKIDLAEKTIKDNSRFFSSIDEVPTTAITMGLANIIEAKEIILIAIGENKKDIIRELFSDDIVTEEIPASILKSHSNVTFYIDETAAKYILDMQGLDIEIID